MLDVVDLGCKEGGALDYFAKRGGIPVTNANCLGIDIRPKYRDTVIAKGFQFTHDDFTRPDFQFPEAKVYLAFHVLEHLDTHEKMGRTVERMIKAASNLVLIRIPAVESNILLKNGLKFAWETWLGHKLQTLGPHDILAAEPDLPLCRRRQFCPVGYIASSDDPRIVPIDAPVESGCYDPKTMKPKPKIDLNVCYEWEVRFER